MSEHALYYPEWSISDPVFMAESLLYWDRIACIVPFPDFKNQPWHQDEDMRKVLAEAHEYLVFNFVPTEEQKNRAHQRIEAFAQHEPPEWCRPGNLKAHHRQIFSAYKFKPETVQMLREQGWTKQYPRPNLVMGALVDSCSSLTMPPVTDDPGSFTANCNLLLRELDAPTGITAREGNIQAPQAPAESDYVFLLAKIPHLSLRPEEVNADVLRRILRARQDPEIDQQRQAFQKKVDEYLEKMRAAEGAERQMLGEGFERALKADLELLNRKLRQVGIGSLSSQDGVVAVILGLLQGALAPLSGIKIAIGLAGELIGYREKRREAFEKHWSSWIFSATTNGLRVW
jgi:hypothetical protein